MEKQYILKYRVERLLGEGGMSRVYLGVDPVTGQRVAIKVLHPHLADHNKIRDLFLQEAESLAKLDHPDIVMLIDFNPEKLVLVQQYIDGMDLEEYITHHRGPIPEEEAKDLFCKLLEAFAYVHSNKVIHRDIKPANILITPRNRIKVVDFGIAKDTQAGHETSTGTRMGTVAYMSPEQIKSKPGEKIDQRTDIYSLGVLLHQMLTGKPPYDTQKESLFDIQLKIVQEPLPRMQGIYEYVSEEMQTIVDKATAKDRNKRYQSCEEFLLAINAPMQPSPLPQHNHTFLIYLSAVVLFLIVVILIVVSGVMSPSRHLAPLEFPVDATIEAPAAPVATPVADYPVETPVAPVAEYPVETPAAPAAEYPISHAIGERYGEGIIFYVDATGQRGLIAAESDIPGPYFTWSDAKAACNNFVSGSFSDWRLPTTDELNELYKKRSVVGGFASSVYWSSPEHGSNFVWGQDFGNGGQNTTNFFVKYGEWRVRPVRAFTH
jgi:eukaryotic-like serine/threonine-protein kinase